MRILHVLEAVVAGVGFYVKTLAEHQRRAGHEVMVALPAARAWGSTDSDLSNALKTSGVEVVEIGIHTFPWHPKNVGAARKLAHLAKDWRPDVMHSHSTAAGTVARPVAARMRIPSVHTPNGLRFSDERKGIRWFGEWAIERSMAPFTKIIVAVSPSEAKVLQRIHAPDRIAMIPNAVSLEAEPPPMPRTPRVVAVNRLVYQKDPITAVKAMATARRLRPELEAVIVGEGPMYNKVKSLATRLDPMIDVVGTTLDGTSAIAASSMLLLSSRWEGAPFVVLEAMSLCRPVVASNVVGTRDVVRERETGFLFSPGDDQTAADHIVRLIDDPGLAASMGSTGRCQVENHSPQQMMESLSEAYLRAMSQR